MWSAMPDGFIQDDTLIERSRTGDEVAIRTLVERHADTAFRMAFRMVGQKAQAEDIAQDVLARMLDYREGWLSKPSLQVWLRRSIYNRAVDIYRKNKNWMFGDFTEALEKQDDTPRQDHQLETQETERRVADAILSLPIRQRAAITLCFYEHLSLAEAASVIGVTPGAVESLLHRAKANLRDKLVALERRNWGTAATKIAAE